MPRRRIKPSMTFAGSKLTIAANPPLSVGQRAQLKRIVGLPAAALAEVETIATHFLALASRRPPSSAQVRARLQRLRRLIKDLREELWEIDGYDAYTLYLISSNYAKIMLNQPAARHFQNLLRLTDIELQQLASAVELTDNLIAHLPLKGESSAVAREVRSAFRKFAVPFSLGKNSPAIETVQVILGMVRPTRPTGYGAVRQAVGRLARGDRRGQKNVAT
jgi:hypothetical protein